MARCIGRIGRRIVGTLMLATAIGMVLAPVNTSNADIVAFWKFEEGNHGDTATGSGTLLDSSGNGLHMSPIGGPTYQTVNSIPNSALALDLDGTNDRGLIADSSAFYLTQGLTIEAFIRYDGGPSGALQQILFRGDSRGGFDPYYFAVRGTNRLEFVIDDLSGSASFLNSPVSSLPTGQVIHVAATLNDSTGEQKIFIDGVEVASKITAIRAGGVLTGSDPGVSIGSLQDGAFGTSTHFNGLIDEVRISNRALDPSEFLNAIPEPTSFGFLCLIAFGTAAFARFRRVKLGIQCRRH